MDPNTNWIELDPPSSLQTEETQPCCFIIIYPRFMMPNQRELKPYIVFLCDDLEKTSTELKSRVSLKNQRKWHEEYTLNLLI